MIFFLAPKKPLCILITTLMLLCEGEASVSSSKIVRGMIPYVRLARICNRFTSAEYYENQLR